ncbi:hypothetical protein RFI_05776 [Reticulomyxa filosa]|uniref:F-actin-capping protein subunit beta n=1 Tax=Reticulomyxa filosa TaxID=46433 RepID=X6NZF8_RETFI|nr:hypothetical protein RFI_05776 [Reticulomyxa filosa]|eukprot:ETO31346.1 hypothetical protein RFI_05776 [Reticulomyxa filosa]
MPLQLKGLGDIDLSGSLTKQASKVCPTYIIVVCESKPTKKKNVLLIIQTATLKSFGDQKQSHLEIMGEMLEDLELDLRNTIEGVYFQKTKEIVNGMRVTDAEIKARDKKMADTLKSAAGNKKP